MDEVRESLPFHFPYEWPQRGESIVSDIGGNLPSLEVTGAIRSNPSTISTLFGQTISTGLDHLLVRPAYISNTQGCRNRNSRKKSCQLGESERDGPWHSELQQETNKTIKKSIQCLIEEGREQVGRGRSNSPSDFAAGFEKGLWVECMCYPCDCPPFPQPSPQAYVSSTLKNYGGEERRQERRWDRRKGK